MPPFILVDGSYYLFRAFHALPPLTTSQGQTTNAIKGALSSLQKLMRRMQPTHMAVIFDTPEPTFRHMLSPEYKAHRPAMPSELSTQIPYLHAIIKGLGIPLLLLPGAEADDLIGTLAKRAVLEGHHVLISTGDKDMAQLVNDHITLEDSFIEKVLDHDGVIAKFGVRPDQIVDYLTLMGDASDGIAGVPGVGKVTAAKLLNQYQTIGGILENAHHIKGKVGESIRENADKIPLNHQLASIVCDLPLALDWHELKLGKPDVPALKKLYAELEFRALLQSLDHPNNPDNPQNFQSTAPQKSYSVEDSVQRNDRAERLENADVTGQSAALPITKIKYQTILNKAEFLALVERLKSAPRFALDIQTTSLDYRLARIVGVSFSLQASEAFYVPIGHDYLDAPEQLNAQFVLETLKPILENPAIAKMGQHLKYSAHALNNHGIHLTGWGFDTMLASYVLNPTATRHGIDELAQHYLNYTTTTLEHLVGKGAKQLIFNQVELEKAAHYAAENADVIWRLYEYFAEALAKIPQLENILSQVEIPAAQVLYEMENNGIRLDTSFLAELGQRFGAQIHILESHAIELAGQPFNVASPKQLGEVLFDKLGIAGGKKTASGQYATGEAILEKIDHPIIATVLEYRSLSKLKSTYTDSLIAQSDPVTRRVHTNYQQAITATGRLSSTDPNLQNIPIRGEVGRQIRQAFVAPPGRIILAADYSQIELRLMAHFSQDEALLAAFRAGRDIHQATAAEVLGIPLAEVNADQRRQAKAINFGLLYGMSAFGLAKQLNLSRAEAQEYITLYFSRYPSVHDYMENTRRLAAEQGYVETVLGRRLYMPDVRAGNAMVRQAAERAAINAPLQGSAADIIKLAMIAVDQALPKEHAKMLLQVHDELVFEVDEYKVDEVTELLKKRMPTVLQGLVDIAVPLEIEVGSGVNWGVAH
jgi:DNA polymerase I